MRPCQADREADVFLLVLGELPPARMPRAAWHWVVCGSCRRSVRRMRRVASRLGRASTPMRVWATRLGTVAAAAATMGGMWVLGREAVGAAMEAMERPKVRNASYEMAEPRQGLPRRPD